MRCFTQKAEQPGGGRGRRQINTNSSKCSEASEDPLAGVRWGVDDAWRAAPAASRLRADLCNFHGGLVAPQDGL